MRMGISGVRKLSFVFLLCFRGREFSVVCKSVILRWGYRRVVIKLMSHNEAHVVCLSGRLFRSTELK